MEKTFTPFRETLTFLKRWCAHPTRLGSMVPSSRALARFMAKSAINGLGQEDCVIELGAGTGRFTQALLDVGIPQDRLLCLEVDTGLTEYLKQRFPQTHIVHGNACNLEDLTPSAFHKKVGVIVSGLPMLSFPHIVQQKILDACFNVLKPNGKLIQFTYSPFASINAERFHMKKERLGWVWGNCPPASVWSYTKQTLW